MQTITLKNYKYESFPIDFRRRVFYTISLKETPSENLIKSVLDDLKYKYTVESDVFFVENLFLLAVEDRMVSIIFYPNRGCFKDRIDYVSKFMDGLCGNSEYTTISSSTLNRYVVSPFENTTKQKALAIKFFFNGIEGDDDTEAICTDSDKVGTLSIKFKSNDENGVFIDSMISSIKLNSEGKRLNLKEEFVELDKFGFNVWRSTVGNAVLKSMRKGERSE